MRYEVRFTNQFKKDLKLAQKQGKDTDKLFEVIEKLANGEKLDAKYRDHDLTGNYKGCRECHVEPDWLLIYEVMGDVLVLIYPYIGDYPISKITTIQIQRMYNDLRENGRKSCI